MEGLRRKGLRRHRCRIGHRAGAGDCTGRSGAKLAISDVDTEGLAVTTERLQAMGVEVKADRLQRHRAQKRSALRRRGQAYFGKVNQIYNNAGIAHTGDIEICEFKEIERVVDVDFWGCRQRHRPSCRT